MNLQNKQITPPKAPTRHNGQGLVEFALVLPILLMIILGIIEFGRLLFMYSSISTASREGARYGAAAGLNDDGTAIRYEDCPGIEDSVVRIGALVGISSSDVTILYDSGPGTSQVEGCPPGQPVDRADRILVRVERNFETVVPLISFPAIPLSATTARTIVKDIEIEGDWTGGGGGGGGGGGETTPDVQFTVVSQNVDENTLSFSVSVSLSAASSNDVSVPFSINASSTAAGSLVDYKLNTSSPLEISAGTTSVNIGFTVVDDLLVEGAETIVIDLGTPTNANLGTNTTHTVTIIDNDSPPEVYFEADQSVTEGAGDINVQVSLNHATSSDVTVPFTINASSTASGSGIDYTLNTASPVTIFAGDTDTVIQFTILQDLLVEGSENIIIDMGTPVNADAGAPNQHTITISDDDSDPEVRFTVAAQDVTEEIVTIDVTVALDRPTGADVTVPFSIDATSTATGGGGDYTLITPTPVTIAAGETESIIQFAIAEDVLAEGDETIYIVLGTPTNAIKGSPSIHTINLIDDDILPEVNFEFAALNFDEDAGTVQIKVTLSYATGADVTVPFSIDATSTATGSGTDYTLNTSTPLSIPAGNTEAIISFTLQNDGIVESDERIIVDLVDLGILTNATLGATTRHTLTIEDNDVYPEVQFISTASTVAENGGSIQVQVVLNKSAASPVSVPFTITNTSTAVGGGVDYTLNTSTPLTFGVNDTTAEIDFTIHNDQVVDGDKTIVIELGSPTGATLGANNPHTVTIEDDEVAVACNITGSAFSWNPQRKTLFWDLDNGDATSHTITKITITWPPHPTDPKKDIDVTGVYLDDAEISEPSNAFEPPSVEICASGCDNTDWTSRTLAGLADDVTFKVNFSNGRISGTYTIEIEFDNDPNCSVSRSTTY